MDKYTVDSALTNFENLERVCSAILARDSDTKDVFWFSWTLFNKTYQTDEFTSKTSPAAMRQMSSHILENDLDTVVRQEYFGLKVCLCTEGKVWAGGMVNPMGDHHTEIFPQSLLRVVPLKPFFDHTPEDVALIHMSFQLFKEEVLPEEREEEYGNEGFEEEEEPVQRHIPYGAAEPTEAQLLELINKSDAQQEEENCNRLFRVVVNIVRLAGLKRPGNISTYFAYPHLGATAAVSSRPKMMMANTATNIDNGVAVFKCTKSRAQMRDTLRKHPCRIEVRNKLNLNGGMEVVGTVDVDLEAVFLSDPLKFRCPKTNREFSTLSEYNLYRIQMHGRGRDLPKEPITVRGAQSVLKLNPARDESRVSLTVMVAIEDLGVVGLLSAEPVPKGYAQAGGALYEAEHEELVETDGRAKAADASAAERDALARGESELERRKMEWELFRAAEEAKWRENLMSKEMALRKQIETECSAKLAAKADDLNRARAELDKQHVQLANDMRMVEMAKMEGEKEREKGRRDLEQAMFAVKGNIHHVRESAKLEVAREKRVVEDLEKQLADVKVRLEEERARHRSVETEFDRYKALMKSVPETTLRQNIATLQGQLNASQAEVERQRRIVAERDQKIDKQKVTVKRLAEALQLERKKSSDIARQEMEQLRLEFLSREEKYILDGDREELREIRDLVRSFSNRSHEAAPYQAQSARSSQQAPLQQD